MQYKYSVLDMPACAMLKIRGINASLSEMLRRLCKKPDDAILGLSEVVDHIDYRQLHSWTGSPEALSTVAQNR